MKSKAIQILAPNNFSLGDVDIGEPRYGDAVVQVSYSSICHTDVQIFAGTLSYYLDGRANYPIITGHEWCGIIEDQPVVGLCILGCGDCQPCINGNPIWCDDRREVGVVNKDGAHADFIIMPLDALISIPYLHPKFSLVEPMAVVVHALSKVELGRKILISGYGSIGRLCGEYLKLHGIGFDIYDPKLEYAMPKSYDLVLECSGDRSALSPHLSKRGIEVLLFGFEYDAVEPGLLVSNEISLLTTLGSTREDFHKSIEILCDSDFDEFVLIDFCNFPGYHNEQKIVLDHRTH